jgi:predicted outer membrane repeat protein
MCVKNSLLIFSSARPDQEVKMLHKFSGRHWISMLIGAVLLVAPLSVSSMLVMATGSRCYVNGGASGANDGTSWGDAYIDLQSALADANCTEIWVAAGTYKPTTGGNRGFSFVLKKGVAIYGGFTGAETQRDKRDWVANVTTLSGDLNGDDVGFTNNGDNSRIVVRGESGTDNTAMLDGFTIRDGNADTCSDCSGGGMYNDHSSPTLKNLIFIFNTANGSGGGMANYNGSNPALTNVIFTDNTTADGYTGGGMYNYASNPFLTNVTFSGNSATSGGGMGNSTGSSPTLIDVTFSSNTVTGDGGGMCNVNSNPTLTDVTFSGNTADQAGGGIRSGASSPSLTNVTFESNTAGTNGGGMENDSNGSNPTLANVTFSGNAANQGGGMYNSEGSPVLTDVTFDGNTAIEGGAGMANIDGSPTLTKVTFSSNIADAPDPQTSGGGGVANYNTYSRRYPNLTNVTFIDNSADYGGGMLNYSHSSPVLTYVTFSGNTAIYGGGIYNYLYSSPTINDVILWGDGTEISSENYSAPTIVDSVVQGDCPSGSTCTNIITSSPMLGTLGNYGGFTQTVSLLWGSSAIDTGNDSVCPATDQRGVQRPQGAHCDIGAYEVKYYAIYLPSILR